MSGKPTLKIAHLTVYGDLPAGVRKQLRYEAAAAPKVEGADWTTIAVHTGKMVDSFERPIPFPFRMTAMRALYGWIVARRLSKQYDHLLVRHMVFDPFAFLFAPFVRNRISVHHSMEVQELRLIRPGISGRIASLIERIAGPFAIARSWAILGVTDELVDYERERSVKDKRAGVYYNGIDLATVDLAPDERKSDALNAIFVCATFSVWHGLDRLIAAVADAPEVPDALTIHLIGELSEQQRALIDALGDRSKTFQIHGFLETKAYAALVAQSDVGIGSLAMDRQNMKQATTLKVREMLAEGIPVYSTHQDSALPAEFPYYVNTGTLSIAGLVDYARSMKAVSRQEVRDAAGPHIDKLASMQSVVNWLKTTG